MGKTYKDQRKYDKKREKETDGIAKGPSRSRPVRRYQEEIIPDDDVLDPYEELDYDDDYYR
jgi:hypothetical protein